MMSVGTVALLTILLAVAGLVFTAFAIGLAIGLALERPQDAFRA